MMDDIEKIILDENKIQLIVDRLASEINSDFDSSEIIFLGLLKGSVVFMSDLIRRINVPCKIDFMAVSSYGSGTVSSGNVKILKDMSMDITGKNVIVVEDIVDSGNTLCCVMEILRGRNPACLKLCS
ncbi:MAG: hypoxanthine phosphoribosyltransferase, partial [Clostridia bacterium]|nr:hypoxanthine phosphoribosyltransferase [Clostridia bacterium]